VGSKDVEDLCLDTGHIGIYVSSKCQKEFAPKIAAWMKARDKKKSKTGRKKATSSTSTVQRKRKKTGNSQAGSGSTV
jgi:polyhydroxyalkanoate synthase